MNRTPVNNLHRLNRQKRVKTYERLLKRIEDDAPLEEKDKIWCWKQTGKRPS